MLQNVTNKHKMLRLITQIRRECKNGQILPSRLTLFFLWLNLYANKDMQAIMYESKPYLEASKKIKYCSFYSDKSFWEKVDHPPTNRDRPDFIV